jgi:hypothetical protein
MRLSVSLLYVPGMQIFLLRILLSSVACLSVSTIFLHIISHTTRLLEKRFEEKEFILIFPHNLRRKHFSF